MLVIQIFRNEQNIQGNPKFIIRVVSAESEKKGLYSKASCNPCLIIGLRISSLQITKYKFGSQTTNKQGKLPKQNQQTRQAATNCRAGKQGQQLQSAEKQNLCNNLQSIKRSEKRVFDSKGLKPCQILS